METLLIYVFLLLGIIILERTVKFTLAKREATVETESSLLRHLVRHEDVTTVGFILVSLVVIFVFFF